MAGKLLWFSWAVHDSYNEQTGQRNLHAHIMLTLRPLEQDGTWGEAEKGAGGMLQRIRCFRLLDDDFMTKCFEENIEATELVLRIVLNKPDIKMVKVQTQYSMKNIKGRSLRLD